MKKILLTGFNPFGKLEANPSQLIVEGIAERGHPGIVAEVLPTEYRRAGERIKSLIQAYQPEAIICLGVAQSRNVISLERLAVNLDDSGKPDNAGMYIFGKTIVPDGPRIYHSTLPLTHMYVTLQQQGIPVVFSHDAGRFVCNHVFYVARHELEQLGHDAACGFIHLPGIRDDENPDGLPLDTMEEAIECCLNVLYLPAEELALFPSNPDVERALAQLADSLPDKPDWTAVFDVEGLFLGHFGTEINIDQILSLSAAIAGLAEILVNGTGHGAFRYTISGGVAGFNCMFTVGEMYLLSVNYMERKSIEALLKSLPELLPPLLAVLYDTTDPP